MWPRIEPNTIITKVSAIALPAAVWLFSTAAIAISQTTSPGVRRGYCLVYAEQQRQIRLFSGYTPPNPPPPKFAQPVMRGGSDKEE